MKPIFILLFALAGVGMPCQAQIPGAEFAVHSNGLIYSPEDMKILGRMVDSLNLRFKSCDLDRTHFSLPQANLWRIKLGGNPNELKAIEQEMKAGKDLSYIKEKYSSYIKSLTLEKTFAKLTSENETYFLGGNPLEGYDDYDKDEKKLSPASPWTIRYNIQSDGYFELECTWQSPLAQQKIPNEYARLIQYVDCMIDTNTTIILKDRRSYSKISAVEPINDYLNQQMGMKKTRKNAGYYEHLNPQKLEYARKNLATDEQFKRLIVDAVDAFIKEKQGGDGIEELAEIVGLKKEALAMKRHRRVMGMCSMDQSPRIHALSIAMLAAQTHSWDIFLRAHLDIMNDRFPRMSDGSYAWSRRQTYLKELEELGLNVTDLMLGLALRSQNTSENHYFGTVWRLGKALAESKDRLVFEIRLINMLKDEQLDEFNRGLLFVLFQSYIGHLEFKGEQEEKINALQASVAGFPASLHVAISKMKKPGE